MPVLSRLPIRSNLRSYEVSIGRGVTSEWIAQPERFVVVDGNLRDAYQWLFERTHIVVNATEECKTIAAAAVVIEQLRSLGATRKSHVVAVGGGITQDVVTFAASAFMRGIDWSYCPTTLLGMVDSCIGGKSSLNVGRYKNLAGNFFPPSSVLVDVDFTRTLSVQQLVEGLCEAAKIAFVGGMRTFDDYIAFWEGHEDISNVDRILAVISLALTTKRLFIEEDEFDQGARLLLNYGHTFGHALEGASEFRLSHGIAVGLGMMASISLARSLGIADPHHPRIEALKRHVKGLLGKCRNLEADLSGLDDEVALQCFRADKKHSQEEFAVILPTIEGSVSRVLLPRNNESEELVRQAFSELRRRVS